MQNKKKEPMRYEPLSVTPTAVSKDGSTISVDGQVFKLTKLASVATKKSTEIKEEAQLEEAFAELDQMRTQEQE